MLAKLYVNWQTFIKTIIWKLQTSFWNIQTMKAIHFWQDMSMSIDLNLKVSNKVWYGNILYQRQIKIHSPYYWKKIDNDNILKYRSPFFVLSLKRWNRELLWVTANTDTKIKFKRHGTILKCVILFNNWTWPHTDNKKS